MARMIPPDLPAFVESPAERRLFGELQRQLPADVTIVFSTRYVDRHHDGHLQDGEADFTIWDPRNGLLVLEVKGGTIRFDRQTDIWTSIDGRNETHRIKNPWRQAETTMHALSRRLRDDRRTANDRFPFCRGVAFPDCRFTGAVGPDLLPEMVIDLDDIPDLTGAVARLFATNRRAGPLREGAIDRALQVIAPIGAIRALPHLATVAFDEQEMIRLTEQQFVVLNLLNARRQGAINGCAGSGKTMLAIEKARQLAEGGADVLLTCYNKGLAAWIREGIAARPDSALRNVTVVHYHDLARQLTEQAGVSLEGRFTEPGFWEETLPELFSQAIPKVETRYDAIIADEGQDFATEWWITLQELLRDPREGVFYIFQDARQALYRDPEDLPVPVFDTEITWNCRNTATIHDASMAYYTGDPKPTANGPRGRAVAHVPVADGERGVIKALQRALATLIEGEGFTLDQIVVLTPASAGRSALTTGTVLGNRRLTRDAPTGPLDVRVSTIHAFKGLESPVVILAEMDKVPASMRRRNDLFYVALSRAKHHLVVLGDLPPLVA